MLEQQAPADSYKAMQTSKLLLELAPRMDVKVAAVVLEVPGAHSSRHAETSQRGLRVMAGWDQSEVELAAPQTIGSLLVRVLSCHTSHTHGLRLGMWLRYMDMQCGLSISETDKRRTKRPALTWREELGTQQVGRSDQG